MKKRSKEENQREHRQVQRQQPQHQRRQDLQYEQHSSNNSLSSSQPPQPIPSNRHHSVASNVQRALSFGERNTPNSSSTSSRATSSSSTISDLSTTAYSSRAPHNSNRNSKDDSTDHKGNKSSSCSVASTPLQSTADLSSRSGAEKMSPPLASSAPYGGSVLLWDDNALNDHGGPFASLHNPGHTSSSWDHTNGGGSGYINSNPEYDEQSYLQHSQHPYPNGHNASSVVNRNQHSGQGSFRSSASSSGASGDPHAFFQPSLPGQHHQQQRGPASTQHVHQQANGHMYQDNHHTASARTFNKHDNASGRSSSGLGGTSFDSQYHQPQIPPAGQMYYNFAMASPYAQLQTDVNYEQNVHSRNASSHSNSNSKSGHLLGPQNSAATFEMLQHHDGSNHQQYPHQTTEYTFEPPAQQHYVRPTSDVNLAPAAAYSWASLQQHHHQDFGFGNLPPPQPSYPRFATYNSNLQFPQQPQTDPQAAAAATVSAAVYPKSTSQSNSLVRQRAETDPHVSLLSNRDEKRRRSSSPHTQIPKQSSAYKGVSWHKRDRRWTARAWVDRRTVHLGAYSSEDLAAVVVDLKLIQNYRKDPTKTRPPRLNFANDKDRDSLLEKALIDARNDLPTLITTLRITGVDKDTDQKLLRLDARLKETAEQHRQSSDTAKTQTSSSSAHVTSVEDSTSPGNGDAAKTSMETAK